MHSDLTKISETKVKLVISATAEDMQPHKEHALNKLSKNVNLAGFRKGTAPLSLVERNIDQNSLQTEFLDDALSAFYSEAATANKIRPVTQPNVNIKKFVPYTSLEFEVETEIVGPIKLGNYKTTKLVKEKAIVTAKDIDEVIKSLKLRIAEKKEVDRAAKKNDEVWIDFKGMNAKGEPVKGAEGKDYPLVIGSNTFIPGFEDNIAGLKPGEKKSFTLTFPKDYGVKALANQKVTFTATVKKVQEVVEPDLDDKFAAKAGPFKTVKELKDDIKKQLSFEKQNELDRNYQNQLVSKLAEKSTVAIPNAMVDQQINYNADEVKRNLTYRGQTYQEFLESEGLSEEKYRDTILRPQAEAQVKNSLLLSEIAHAENLIVTPEELEIRIQVLKNQYKDPAMQANLDKQEYRQDIGSRILTEKVLAKLEEYAGKSTNKIS